MNKTELIAGLREHLAGKESIANEAAPALKLMRYSLVELEKPTSGGEGQALFNHLNEELKNADGIITQLRDTVSDREGFIYALLAELALVPEIDGEPVGSLEEAITQQPDILDMLQERVSAVLAPVPEINRKSLSKPSAPFLVQARKWACVTCMASWRARRST